MIRLTRAAAAGFAAAAALAALPPSALAAFVDTASPAPVSASLGTPLDDSASPGPVADCLGAGDVWLVVVDDAGVILANQCVGTPASGTAALDAAGLLVGRDASGYLCSIGSYPDPCPASFTGKYWQYYTGSPTSPWTYYTVGSDQSQPAPGALEGWCYGEVCAPPDIAALMAGQVDAGLDATPGSAAGTDGASSQAASSASPAAQDGGAGSPAPLVATIAVVIALIAVALALSARRQRPGKAEA